MHGSDYVALGWVEVKTYIPDTNSRAAALNPIDCNQLSDTMRDWLKRNAGTWRKDWYSEGWRFYIRDPSMGAAFKLMFQV